MKITILGAGTLGSQIAMLLAMRGWENVWLFDEKNPDKCHGECDDINQMLSVMEKDHRINPSITYSQSLFEADFVIMAVGRRRKDGETRDDLWPDNRREVVMCSRAIREYAPSSTVLVITNPVDRAYETVKEITGFASNRIIKQGSQLDTARLREIISKKRGIRRSTIQCRASGTHDENMRLEYESPNPEIDQEAIYCAINTIREKGATVFAPAMCTVKILEDVTRLSPDIYQKEYIH